MKYTKPLVIDTDETIRAQWEKVDIVLAGTNAIRSVDQCKDSCISFMPQETCESDLQYKNKVSRAVLEPYYKEGVENAVSLVCGNGYIFTEEGTDIEEVFDPDFLANVDGQGSSFEVFIRKIAHCMIHYGVCYVFTDTPAESVSSDVDDNAAFDAHRPYFSIIKPLSVITRETRRFGAIEILTKFEWEYCTTDVSEDKVKKKIHMVIDDDDCEEAESEEDKKDRVLYADYSEGDIVWTIKEICDGKEVVTHGLIDNAETIPIETFIGNEVCSFLGKPVFNDLCDMNIDQYQVGGALKVNLYSTSSPMITLKGIEPTRKKPKRIDRDAACDVGGRQNESDYESVEMGPNKIMFLGKEGELKVHESTGAGAESLTVYLDRLILAMDRQIKAFSCDEKNVTATATIEKKIEVKSTMETIKDNLISGLNGLIGLYNTLNESEPDKPLVVNITVDVQTFLDGNTKTIITELYDIGAITIEGYAETLKQFLPDGIKVLGAVDLSQAGSKKPDTEVDDDDDVNKSVNNKNVN